MWLAVAFAACSVTALPGTIGVERFAAFDIYIMLDMATRDHTPRTLPATHLTAYRWLLRWTTSTMSPGLLS